MYTDRPLGPRVQGIGAQDPHPNRMLPGPQVDHVGSPTGHRVVQPVQDSEGGINHRGVVPLVRPDENVTPDHFVVGYPNQVDRAPAARG